MLINECCLNALPLLADNSVDLIIADMPYGTTRCKWDSIIPLNKLWPELARVKTPKAAIILFAQTPFDKVLGSSNLAWLRYEWIWEKANATGFFNAKKMPLKAHENILVFYERLPTYNPIKTSGHRRVRTSRGKQLSEVYGKAVNKTHYDSTERYPRSVVKYDKALETTHPTQKPLALVKYLVETYSNVDDTVLDFCVGSGTTYIAAKQTNRMPIGIEKDPSIFRTAVNRIATHEY